MTNKKIICIGDVHGCLEELKELLEKVGWSKSRSDFRIILLGDLVDRGPDSIGVIRFVRENNIEVVRGNHDDRYIKYYEKLKWHDSNPKNTKPAWLEKHPDRKKIFDSLSDEDIAWLYSTPTSILIPEYKTVAVHAGFKPGVPISQNDDDTKMHIRFLFEKSHPAFLEVYNDYNPPSGSRFWAEDYEDEWHVVYGHHVWDFNFIKIHENSKGYKCYGIDTGVCFGGKLTALELSKDENHKIYQVNSRQFVTKKGN